MNFGKWIVVAFVAFAAYIFFLVAVCVKQDVSLVSKEYYKDELRYQEKLNQINNTSHLKEIPKVEIQNGRVKILFAENQIIQGGKVKIERPSNEKLDRIYSLTPGQSFQEFDLREWRGGLYRASVSWTMDGKDFYFEKQIIL